jgi:hypothetical protein
VRSLAAQFGTVVSIRVLLQRGGSSAYAFALMATETESRALIRGLNGAMIGDMKLQARLSTNDIKGARGSRIAGVEGEYRAGVVPPPPLSSMPPPPPPPPHAAPSSAFGVPPIPQPGGRIGFPGEMGSVPPPPHLWAPHFDAHRGGIVVAGVPLPPPPSLPPPQTSGVPPSSHHHHHHHHQHFMPSSSVAVGGRMIQHQQQRHPHSPLHQGGTGGNAFAAPAFDANKQGSDARSSDS